MVKLKVILKNGEERIMDYYPEREGQTEKFNNALDTGFIKDYEVLKD